MSLAPGTRLGPYEITGQIGVGGMGEVYRARDTKLNRDVALKILPDAFAGDPDRLARFIREAQTLASLNHPNIAIIHGLEQAGDVHALVMELVEGDDLSQRIARGAIPIEEALPIAKQIAEALEAAHEQGIIHRDLKPANIKVRPDGTVKVLDFGLAKAMEPAVESAGVSQSPTITTPALTQAGVILGTAAYMSPEQAKGKPSDKRSDVWAFGCVLYEMLAGNRAFGGEDVSDTLAAVLRGEPEWTALPPLVSPAIVALIRGCLAKDPRQRIGDVSTARFIFDHGTDVAASVPAHSLSILRRPASILIASTAAAVIAAYVTWMVKPATAPLLPLARFPITLPTGDRFSNYQRHLVALSPDGSRLVYAANQRLYMRAMDQLESTPIRGTEGPGLAAGRSPFFSPDGQWIGFWQNGQLKKVPTSGGAPVPLCAAITPFGASWSTDNTILFGQGARGIWRVSGDGGTPENVVQVDTSEIAHGPQLLPGGRAVLFTLARDGRDWDAAQIVVQSLDTGGRHVLKVEGGTDARYVPTGHLVYARRNTLLAVPFDVATLAVTGGEVSLVEDVARAPQHPIGLTGAAHFATASQGALVYVPADALDSALRQRRILIWVDRQRREDPIQVEPRAYLYPRLSRDATRVALDIRDQQNDIWILDLARPALRRLTFGPATEAYAIWTPNEQAVIFSSGQSPFEEVGPRNLFRQAPDAAGTPEQLTEGAVTHLPYAVTPDGAGLIFGEQKVNTSSLPSIADRDLAKFADRAGDLMLLPLLGQRRAQSLFQTEPREMNAEISPDGQWLAYQSNKSGHEEIYIRTFPNVATTELQVSTSGGTQPLWARNGRELFYVSMGTLMRVPLTTTGSTVKPGTPVKALEGPYFYGAGVWSGRTYDVSPDGRFLMIKEIGGVDEPTTSARLILVQNWFEELKRRVPTQ